MEEEQREWEHVPNEIQEFVELMEMWLNEESRQGEDVDSANKSPMDFTNHYISELNYILNYSCGMIEACLSELGRRQGAYYAWKKKNDALDEEDFGEFLRAGQNITVIPLFHDFSCEAFLNPGESLC